MSGLPKGLAGRMVGLRGLSDKRFLGMGAVYAFHHIVGRRMSDAGAGAADTDGDNADQPVAADEPAVIAKA